MPDDEIGLGQQCGAADLIDIGAGYERLQVDDQRLKPRDLVSDGAKLGVEDNVLQGGNTVIQA